MKVDAFMPFVLVGGTSLALQIGHRISIDLDLFGDNELDEYEMTNILNETDILKEVKNYVKRT